VVCDPSFEPCSHVADSSGADDDGSVAASCENNKKYYVSVAAAELRFRSFAAWILCVTEKLLEAGIAQSA
jgi:hypothetical protein